MVLLLEIKPKLIIIAAPNGSGKTSVTHKIHHLIPLPHNNRMNLWVIDPRI